MIMDKVLTWEERFADINAMRQRFALVMSELIEKNPSLALVLADITAERFTNIISEYPDRVVNVGIREQLMIDVAAGMSLAGLRPFAHTFSSFLIERPFEQIKIALNHQQVGAVLVSAGASYDLAVDGRTHQSPADIALLSTLEDWKIMIPGNAQEAEHAIRKAADDTGLYYIRLSTETNMATYWQEEDAFSVLKSGTRGTIVSVGPVTDRVMAACAELDVTVLYAPFISPFDTETLLKTLTVPDIAIVEPYLVGTSSFRVSNALKQIPHRLLALGVQQKELRNFGTPEEHIRAHGLDTLSLRKQLTTFFDRK
ncbi:1-deoxy-D-xylulose-5-phosphate synthase [Serratia fonticola]|nr:1-deoxy-D-xylulose-5-phosphate synthase [Serratia fonticola]